MENSTYIIEGKQKGLIRKNFFQWSLRKPDNYVPDKKLFNQLTHPAELHYLADIYNWDDGVLVLKWILDSALCSRSTANLLFWRSAPDYYLQFDLSGDECPSHNMTGFFVIKKILEKYENNNFCDVKIQFSPTKEIEKILTKEQKWKIPSGMYDKIRGIKVAY
jgi:hypothetical protein